ncbi:hypothetical protein VT99_12052, partial [Candidatus Electrothrix marina]
ENLLCGREIITTFTFSFFVLVQDLLSLVDRSWQHEEQYKKFFLFALNRVFLGLGILIYKFFFISRCLPPFLSVVMKYEC